MQQNEIEKKEYELSFLLKSEAGIAVLQGMLNKFGCEVVSQSEVKRSVLAYPIKKETSALFGYAFVMIDPAQVKEFSHELRLEPEVLRFLVIANPIKRSFQPATDNASRGHEHTTNDKTSGALTNEDLERKLEEILN